MADKLPKEFIVYSPSRASFEALVASGEVDNTQIGIIAESGEFWENGNYHPLVMLSDYLKKTDAVALAKDLTGSIEATPEEFTFRPSAGTKSIRDESAVIRRIKGNTSVWNQVARFRNSTTLNGLTITNEDNILRVSGTLTEALSYDTLTLTSYLSEGLKRDGRKYLISLNAPDGVAYGINGYSIVNTKPHFWSHTASSVFHGYISIKIPVGTTVDYVFSNPQIIDLSQTFVAGKEPSTVEEFKKIYPDSYYPYCKPEVRSMRATGIETIGANAFDKDNVVGGLINADGTVTSNDIYSVAKIEVVPYEKYTLTNVANAANTTYTYALYDSEDRFISIGEIKNSVTKPVSVSGDVTMPLNARYIRVVVHNDYLDSCCVNLKHSGTLTAEEATYFKEVRMLPDIAKYFPDGMHGIGDVYDEINEENAIKRFGVVDLGTLTWGATITEGRVNMRFYSNGLKGVVKPPVANSQSSNIVNIRYDSISVDGTYLHERGISIDTQGQLQIYDPDMNTADDLADMTASLQGVLLYYELDEPIVTPITEPLQWDYKVADFGTEKMLSTLPSSPFRADIVYQFNAADRIRDNARNIERLEEHTKNMATMEDIINAIPTEIAEATQVEEYTVTNGSQLFLPNVMYEYLSGIGQAGVFVMPNIAQVANSTYDDRWMLRLPSIATSEVLTFPYTIKWQNGVAPNFTEAGALEIYLKKIATGEIIGEWKIYV